MKHLIRHVRQAAAAVPPDTDAELLAAFALDRDPAAFAAIVDRHGPMVYAACRRLLRDPNDVDDAFQAVFLVLIRKAGSVRGAQLAGWLYGVALRTARASRKLAARRRRLDDTYRARVLQAAEVRPDPVEADDLRAVLDRELSHLTESARSAVVLCDLEGRTRKEAAAELGWPEGTLATRLARAREVLAYRLARAGVTLSVPALVTSLAAEAAAVVPPRLREAVARVAAGAGQAAASVVGIANRVPTGAGVRVFAFGAGVFVAAAAASGLILMADRPVVPPPRPVLRAPPPRADLAALAPAPREAVDLWLVATSPTRTVAIRDTDGAVRDPAPVPFEHEAVPAPTGTRWIKVAAQDGLPDQLLLGEAGPGPARRSRLHLFTSGAPPRFADPSWSPEGLLIICCTDAFPRAAKGSPWQVAAVGPYCNTFLRLTGESEPVSMPRFHPDSQPAGPGLAFAYRKEVGRRGNRPVYDLVLRTRLGTDTIAHRAEVIDYAFDPHGTTVAISIAGVGIILRDLWNVTERLVPVEAMGLDPALDYGQLRWRPDGQALAFRPVFVRGTRFEGKGLTLVQSPRAVTGLDRVGFVRLADRRPSVVTYPLAAEFQLSHWREAAASPAAVD
jgi:RNA polymerase sigma factor (sigma-70 family)